MNNFAKGFLPWIIALFVMIILFNAVGDDTRNARDVSYSQFLGLVDQGQVAKVKIRGKTLIGEGESGTKITTKAPNDPDLVKQLRSANVEIVAEDETSASGSVMSYFLSLLPLFLLFGFIYFMMMRQAGGKGGAMSFGKSRANLVTDRDVKVRFKDVAGVDEAKQDLQEVVDFLKDPQKFQRLGGKMPHGLLLVGPPGTGKTLLARSVAGEAGVPFFSISGSDFVEMFVGVGAARVRDLFEQGKRNAPCIIFIDEIDAVGRHRGVGIGGGNDEREQTLNQLLVEMDGFETNEGIILIAASNRPDVLDPALLRPGRFDRQVTVPLPDIGGREHILNVHIRKVPVAADVDASILARGTPGFSGADLANLVNEAALMAARKDKRLVDMADFEAAKDKVMMGAERRSAVLTADQQKTTAYHEAGHAIVALELDGPTDPLHKVTIIPRGRALGVTMQLPEEDKVTYDKKYLENQIAILMGGRLAEELILDQKTTGASNDIERATDIAKNMVCTWGMSDKMGPLNYAENEQGGYLGRGKSSVHGAVSGEVGKVIDTEIRNFIDTNYNRAKKCLEDNMDKLHKLAEALLEHETLDSKEIEDLFAGKPIVKKEKPKRRKERMAKKASETVEEQAEKIEDVVDIKAEAKEEEPKPKRKRTTKKKIESDKDSE